jgi:hypothetical protein
MKDFFNFVLQFQQNLLTVPAIVFFMTIAVTVQANRGAQDRLVAGLIGALAPVAYYERKTIGEATSKTYEGLARRLGIASSPQQSEESAGALNKKDGEDEDAA